MRRTPSRWRESLTLVLALAALTMPGCGDGERPSRSPAVPWVDPDGDAPYIGSLAVNPADGALFLSSNTGLFRIAGDRRPRKLTGTLRTPDGEGRISNALVIRFTGPDQMIGSGHPPKDSTMPAALGLIRSDDAGRTWRSVSELGAADFHAIVWTGGLLAAPEYGLSQILLSRDGGHRFENRAGPLPLVDLAIDPADSTRWVATAETGLFVSLDEGRTWRQRDTVPNAHLAWVRPDALYRVEPDGPVKVSTDGGRAWIARGDAGGEPQAIASDARGVLYVALLDGTLKRSRDGGRTWTIRTQGALDPGGRS